MGINSRTAVADSTNVGASPDITNLLNFAPLPIYLRTDPTLQSAIYTVTRRSRSREQKTDAVSQNVI